MTVRRAAGRLRRSSGVEPGRDLGSPPCPRPERLRPAESGDPAPAAVATYAAGHDDLVLAGAEAVELVTHLLDEAGINYLTVSGRTKSVASFAEKAVRSVDGVRLYTDPLREIGDQLGVRVITYVRDDVDAVADLLADQVVVNDDRDLGRETASEGRFGYASRHLQICLDAARVGQPAYAHLAGRNVQVQIRTVLQHAWAEFEHDIRYKGTVPAEHAHDFDRRFTLAAGLLELADQEFATIRDRLRVPASSAEHVEPASPSCPTATTRASTPASSRRSWPASTPTPAGRAPTTTPGSPGCCSSWASPRSTSSATCCAPPTRR